MKSIIIENIMMKRTQKKAQVTIFVIMAILIVVAIALSFSFYKSFKSNSRIENPQEYIEQCIKDSLEKAEEQVLENNGYFNGIEDNYILYQGEKVPYLCKASEFYQPCVNQEPNLEGLIKKDLKVYIKEQVKPCFESLKKEFEKKAYSFEIYNGELQEQDIDISFIKTSIKVSLSKKILIKKQESSQTIEIFRAEIQSPLYDLLDTARNIVNYESQYCEFDSLNWMRVYSSIKIREFRAGDQTKVYLLENENTNKKLNFAVKTCVLPAGL